MDALDMLRESVLEGLWIVTPVLVVGLLLAIGIGLLQSLTQIHDTTLAFIPKVIVTAIVIACALPWLAQRMTDFSVQQWERPLLVGPPSTAPVTEPPSTPPVRLEAAWPQEMMQRR